jgi:hypothetical protein
MTQTLFSEPTDSYSTTKANPNMVWVDIVGDFLVTWERKNPNQTFGYSAGIYYEYGRLSIQTPNFGGTINHGSPVHVNGTDANSVNASISCNGAGNSLQGLAFQLAWEEDANSMSSQIGLHPVLWTVSKAS